MSYWCSLVTSLSKAPSSETIWTVLAIMASALIAVGAAFLSAWLTMKNARKLQDRERRRDEKSVAALVSADLYGKLSMLVRLLPRLNLSHVDVERLGRSIINLEQRLTGRVVLEAALPKLGSLGHRDTANLLGAFDGLALVVDEARRVVEASRVTPDYSSRKHKMSKRARHVESDQRVTGYPQKTAGTRPG